jgi:hypothetical protein
MTVLQLSFLVGAILAALYSGRVGTELKNRNDCDHPFGSYEGSAALAVTDRRSLLSSQVGLLAPEVPDQGVALVGVRVRLRFA